MRVIEQVWNSIYLDFNFDKILNIENSTNSFTFRGYGEYRRSVELLDGIRDITLRDANIKDFTFFIDDEKLRRKYNPNKYSTMDYVFRHVAFSKEDEYEILNILIFCSVKFIEQNDPFGREENVNNFIEGINTILHQFNKKFLDKKIISIETPLQESNVSSILTILDDSRYGVAKKEYEEALQAYEQFKFKTTLTECNNAFESVLKCTCTIYNISTKADTVKKLVDVLKENSYFKNFESTLENINQLIGLLTSGVNTIRNKQAGHGGGLTPNDPDEILAKLVLDMTAAFILFFVKANRRTSL